MMITTANPAASLLPLLREIRFEVQPE